MNSIKIRAAAVTALFMIALAVPASAGATTDVVVQGTTDVRDAGLLNDVIVPGFDNAYPQYNLKYIAVGTGQALTNAEAGQGDAVLTHAPTLEAQFVAGGYSYEPYGRAIFYSDYVILGPASDPARVLSGAPNNAAQAYSQIAAAGAAGKANFVSRGDNSGTNVEEKLIWKLTGVPLNSNGEPGTPGTTSNPSWYHKAGAGQAQTVQLTDQCPFAGGGCYEMTDRGTFNHLLAGGSIHHLKIVAQRNLPSAPGGQFLLVNSFHAYAVNPTKVPGVNLRGALAFLSYLTSPGLQNRLATYPSAQNPAFFADARPVFKQTGGRVPGRVKANRRLRVSGTLAPQLPGAGFISGVPALLEQPNGRGGFNEIGHTLISNNGFSVSGLATRNGEVDIVFPGFHDLSFAAYKVGSVSVQAVVGGLRARVRGNTISLSGSASPSRNRVHAQLVVLAKRPRQKGFHAVKTVRASGTRSRFGISLRLGAGSWRLEVTYRDPGVVGSGTSRSVSVSLP
jgi:tungstate transport system substrate-binding protein